MMTEAEWLACTNPQIMLQFLDGKVSDRKLRLFAVACCRRIEQWMTDERSRRAVDVSEAYADGVLGKKKLSAARKEAFAASKSVPASPVDERYLAAPSHAAVVALYGCYSIRRCETSSIASFTAGSASSLIAHIVGE